MIIARVDRTVVTEGPAVADPETGRAEDRRHNRMIFGRGLLRSGALVGLAALAILVILPAAIAAQAASAL